MTVSVCVTDMTVRHQRVHGDGLDLHVAVAGAGPPVILLHGSAENWRSWRKQIGPLVRGGFSVWLPDLEVGHWVQSEAPDEVNRALVEFLGQGTTRVGTDGIHLA